MAFGPRDRQMLSIVASIFQVFLMTAEAWMAPTTIFVEQPKS